MAQQKTITVSIPHHLGQADAKQRIQAGLDAAATQFAGKVGAVERTWTDNRLDLKITAMGQSITGRVDVQPDTVRIDVDLPWLLAMMAEKVRGQIEVQGRKLLERTKQ